MDSYEHSKLKIVFFVTSLSICIVFNVNYVSVLSLESKYSFIWLWASKSPARLYEFYYIPFITNCLICIVFLSIAIMLSTLLKRTVLKFFWFIIIPIVIIVIRASVGFYVFDFEIYPFEPSRYVDQSDIQSEYIDKVYCNYWSFGIDNNYSYPELCGRPN